MYFLLYNICTAAAQIGVIGGVMPWLQMLSQPAWGVFADKVRTRKVIALVCFMLNFY